MKCNLINKIKNNYKMSVLDSHVNDFFTVFIMRPIASVIVCFLVNSRILPNHITLFGFLLHLTAIIFILNNKFFIAGMLLFIVYLLDCVDGQLAREKNIISKFGYALDITSDFLKELLLFVSFVFIYRKETALFFLSVISTLLIMVSFHSHWLPKLTRIEEKKEEETKKNIDNYKKLKNFFRLSYWSVGIRYMVYAIFLIVGYPQYILMYVLIVGSAISIRKYISIFTYISREKIH